MDGIVFDRDDSVTTCYLEYGGETYVIGCFSNTPGESGNISIAPGCRKATTTSEAWSILLDDANYKREFISKLC